MNKKIKTLERALKTAERKAGSEQQKLAALHKKALAKQDCTAERAKKALTKKLEVAEANNVATNAATLAACEAKLEACELGWAECKVQLGSAQAVSSQGVGQQERKVHKLQLELARTKGQFDTAMQVVATLQLQARPSVQGTPDGMVSFSTLSQLKVHGVLP